MEQIYTDNLQVVQPDDRLALTSSSVSTKVHRTYTNWIQLTFDPGSLDNIWKMRFERNKATLTTSQQLS